MYNDQFQPEESMPTTFGITADLNSGVDIGKVYGGYFSNPSNIERFCELGIKPIVHLLPHEVKYIDFGGGQGTLAHGVAEYLRGLGHAVLAIVADSNPHYLKAASQLGLNTKLCNVARYRFTGAHLITMRSVLHYNAYGYQYRILKRAYESLRSNGVLVHQFTSGAKDALRLRSDIVNSTLLERPKGSSGYRWITVEEYREMAWETGFRRITRVGNAPDVAWGPREQWLRFHGKALRDAESQGDLRLVAELNNKLNAYLAETRTIVDRYLSKFSAEHLGIEWQEGGNYLIHSSYPVVISLKPKRDG